MDGKEIHDTKNIDPVADQIQKYCQKFIVKQFNRQFENIAQSAYECKGLVSNLLGKIHSSSSIYTEQVITVLTVIKNDVQILTDICQGNFQLDKLSDDEKTRLQESFNPKKEEIQKAQPEFVPSQAKEAFEQQLINLINEKSRQPAQIFLLGLLSDYIDDAIEDGQSKSKDEIMNSILNSKKKTLNTLQDYVKKHKEWVEKFIDCYIKAN